MRQQHRRITCHLSDGEHVSDVGTLALTASTIGRVNQRGEDPQLGTVAGYRIRTATRACSHTTDRYPERVLDDGEDVREGRHPSLCRTRHRLRAVQSTRQRLPVRHHHRGRRTHRDDVRRVITRFASDNIRANQPLLDLISSVAEDNAATPAQIALAWILHKSKSIVPTPGARTSARINENLGAAEVELTEEQFAQLEAELARIEIHGNRRPIRTSPNCAPLTETPCNCSWAAQPCRRRRRTEPGYIDFPYWRGPSPRRPGLIRPPPAPLNAGRKK